MGEQNHTPLRRAGAFLWRGAVFVGVHLGLFILGTSLFLPSGLAESAAAAGDNAAAVFLLPVVAALDVAILAVWILHLRLRGWRAWLVVALVYWGVKAVTSQIEAAVFMPNVDALLASRLALMLLPLCLLLPLVMVVLLGRWRRSDADEPAWVLPTMSPLEWSLKIGALVVLVYPALFFGFGYFVAFASPEVRAFYGATDATFWGSMRENLTSAIYPLEVFRGVLWIVFAAPLLFATRGHWAVRGLLTALVFAIIQNDVHLLPNPMMPAELRLFHFIETASSNALWGFAIAFALHAPGLGAAHRGARPWLRGVLRVRTST